MEWSLHSELLLALKPQSEQTNVPVTKSLPEVQALFCIDDRECSLRRHLEEIHPAIETFGAAGFFGIDFLYQGLDDAYPVAQCPNIIVPKHLIKESGSNAKPDKKAKTGNLTNMHFTAHTMWRGWLYTQTLGLGYAARMAWNVFRPGSKLPGIRTLSEVETHSQLHLLRESEEPTEDGYLLGFSFPEMADRLGGLLRNIGLTQNFAPLVVVVAHGSSSVNNPHLPLTIAAPVPANQAHQMPAPLPGWQIMNRYAPSCANAASIFRTAPVLWPLYTIPAAMKLLISTNNCWHSIPLPASMLSSRP